MPCDRVVMCFYFRPWVPLLGLQRMPAAHKLF